MVNWIAGHTDRFAALVSHDGTFDLASKALETEELWFPKWEFKGWPWSSDLYAKWNPMPHAGNFKTPTLVITNENDYRVPFGQGLQMFTALQVQNVPSKLLMFPGRGPLGAQARQLRRLAQRDHGLAAPLSRGSGGGSEGVGDGLFGDEVSGKSSVGVRC